MAVGHERIGFLPKTKQWQAIIDSLSNFEASPGISARIADATLSSIKKSYERMPYDESISKAIKFLAMLSSSANKSDQVSFLNENGFSVDTRLSLYSLVNSAKNFITTENGSLETNKLARDSVMQAVTEYQRAHSAQQISLFGNAIDSVWKNVGNGAAFCELARSFFAALTDRQIKYYVGREAASKIDDYADLQSFSLGITQVSESISHHAFETSKIMQSFAAGWYNKHANNNIPDDSKVTSFLKIAFGKMREEFRREAEET